MWVDGGTDNTNLIGSIRYLCERTLNLRNLLHGTDIQFRISEGGKGKLPGQTDIGCNVLRLTVAQPIPDSESINMKFKLT